MRIDSKGVLINYRDDPEETRLVIPPTVKRIAPHAFYGAEYLEEIVISDGVTDIGAESFQGCPELRRVYIPDSVTRMGKRVFKDCRRLADVRLPAGLTEIPDFTFDGCLALETVYIPDGVKSIWFDAFNSCVALRSVRLPDTLTFIDSGVFMETFSLKEITIPDSVEDIGGYTFFRSGLERIEYRGMEIFLDRIAEESHTFEFCFSRTLSEWLESGGKGNSCVPVGLRIPFLLAYYVKTRSPQLAEYVKKNFSKLCGRSIRLGDIRAVRAFIDEGFLTRRNLDRYIGQAQELGQHEIYLMLVEHKEKLGGYKGGSGRFRL